MSAQSLPLPHEAPAQAQPLPAVAEGRAARWALSVGGMLVYAFLYLPLAIVILYSFNGSAVSSWPVRQWSLAAYSTLAADDALTQSIRNSLYVSTIAVALALALGTAAALGFHRLRIPGKELFSFAVTLPIVLPGIVTGIAMLTLFTDISAWSVDLGGHELNPFTQLSLTTVIVGHVTFCLVLVFNSVRARLARVPPQLAEAARDLGAGPWRTFWHVTLPTIRTAVISGALLAFTLSFDEVVVSFFLAGRDNTLPLEIWSRLRRGTISPELNAAATLLIAVSVALVLASQFFVREE